MEKFLTILCAVSAVASIIAFIHIIIVKKANEKRIKKVESFVFFLISLILTIYLLFAPTTPLEKNVESKISLFDSTFEDKDILIQQGEFTYVGIGEQSIEFSYPYKDIPNVEIENINGYNGAPSIQSITKNQFIVSRNYTIEPHEKYKWIARGVPLKQIKEN